MPLPSIKKPSEGWRCSPGGGGLAWHAQSLSSRSQYHITGYSGSGFNAQQVEAGGSGIQGYSSLLTQYEACLGYTRPYLTPTKQNNKAEKAP